MRSLPGFKSPLFIRLTAFVLIFAFTWATTAAGPAPKTAQGVMDRAQAISTPEKDKSKEEEIRPVAIAGKASETSAAKKPFPWLIVGAAAVAVVVVILLLTKKSDTTGKISVSSTPPGAKVYLDGSDTAKTSPCTLTDVAPGSHTVKLSLDGYKDSTQTVTVTAGQTATVTVSLTKHAITVTEPAGGSSKPRGVEIDIRWSTDSNLSQNSKMVAMGLRLPGSGGAKTEGDVSFTVSTVNIDLYKAGAKVLTIAANTANDGAEKWTIPASQMLGSDYKVRVACSTDATVYGESGTFSIAGQYGSVAVTTTPAGANVWLDGADTGQSTPCTLANVTAGTHHLKVVTASYGKWEGDIDVVSSQTTNVNVNLTPFSYDFVTAWGSQGSGNGQFASPRSVAVDASRNVYVADYDNHRIQKCTSDGTYIAQWGGHGSSNGQFDGPAGIAFDSSGNVLVADFNNHRIQKFTSTGTYLTKWGSIGSGSGQFLGPAGIAVDSSQNVYVADTNNNRIEKFASDGTYLAKWGSSGSGNGQLQWPFDVKIDLSGNVYVSDQDNNRIQKFTSDGTFVKSWGNAGAGNGEFNIPGGIAWQSPGVIFVADFLNHRIQKFSDTGTYLMQWGTQGSGNGQFRDPYDVAVDSAGYVYVADSYNYRIQKFVYSGNASPSVRITYTPMVEK